ncbi:hypothetical protein VKT23_015801 [Stygiomarasmius scandens]|uniref:Chromo shadow domain-containing protein n=1 Tax=Marasmiellus scandens TaxID=2682957 RepID=A0ABR1IYT5_9AGAR
MLGFVAEKDPNSSGDEETNAIPLRKRPQIYPLEQKTIGSDTLPTKPTESQIHSNVSSEIVIINQLTEENELKLEQEKGWRFLEKYLIKENWEDIVECVHTVDNGGPPPDLKDSDISRDTLFVYFELTEDKGNIEVCLPLSICKQKFPQKLLDFFESRVEWDHS